MCIAVLCTSHPDYPYILISNRDEYLTRPTARAHFWSPPNSHVLAGRDLHRPVQGTWLGITRSGRLAVLTNFRDDDAATTQPLNVSGLKSRGAMVNRYLCADDEEGATGETTEEFARRLVEEEGVGDVGGFSLLFGRLRPFDSVSSSSSSSSSSAFSTTESGGAKPGLAIISNRSASVGDITYLATTPTEVHALSNSHYGDLTWPKVVHGEAFVRQAVQSNVQRKAGKQDLLDRLFEILSLDTLGVPREGQGWEEQLRLLRNSIFIPRIGEGRDGPDVEGVEVDGGKEQEVVTSGNGWYGTQKQTVILVDRRGHVDFIEKTLFDGRGRPLEDSKEEFSFDIEGWGM